MIEGQKKHNRGAYREMCDRVQKETEEKKLLQAKLVVLKNEYRKVTAPGGTSPFCCTLFTLLEGPTPAEMRQEIDALKQEIEVKTSKLNAIQAEFKALAHKHALLEAAFESG